MVTIKRIMRIVGWGGDILNDRNGRESIDDADALLEKIKNGTLGTNFTIPESVEKQLKDKKASLTREYEKERKQLMERMQTPRKSERSEVLSASRKYLENAKIKAASERGPIDAEQLSYYNSLLGEPGSAGGR